MKEEIPVCCSGCRWYYLMTPAIDGEDDPLAWFRVHKISWPQLCTMARMYLCVPATSAPSERSTGGNMVTCTRSSLKPAKVNMLVFLAKSLWATQNITVGSLWLATLVCVLCYCCALEISEVDLYYIIQIRFLLSTLKVHFSIFYL